MALRARAHARRLHRIAVAAAMVLVALGWLAALVAARACSRIVICFALANRPPPARRVVPGLSPG